MLHRKVPRLHRFAGIREMTNWQRFYIGNVMKNLDLNVQINRIILKPARISEDEKSKAFYET